jgi:predicted DNA-binding protein (MmcQ/YjbR family)
MTIEILQAICEQFPGVTQDIKWEDHLCFNVGDKMFLVTSPGSLPHTASFKASDEEFEVLCSREGLQPAPYMARYKWVYVDDISRLSRKEWEKYLKQSYHLVFTRLPAKKQREITG